MNPSTVTGPSTASPDEAGGGIDPSAATTGAARGRPPSPPAPPPPPARLARWHAWARAQPWLHRFTLANRLLLAMAFFPTGLVKATGQRFTTLPVDNPVGFFFEAMYQTGPYWHFIGFAQIAASVLLLIPATATVGALLFFPVILSIVLITWGVGFTGTVYVTTAMLVAVVYLLCWDADRVWAAAWHVFGTRRSPALLADATPIEHTGWILGGTAGMGVFLITRGFLPRDLTPALLVAGAVAVILVLAGWVAGASRRRGARRG